MLVTLSKKNRLLQAMQEDVLLLSDLRAQLPVIGDSAIRWDSDHDSFAVAGVVLRKCAQASQWLVEDQDTHPPRVTSCTAIVT
jgi:hypothetical protein